FHHFFRKRIFFEQLTRSSFRTFKDNFPSTAFFSRKEIFYFRRGIGGKTYASVHIFRILPRDIEDDFLYWRFIFLEKSQFYPGFILQRRALFHGSLFRRCFAQGTGTETQDQNGKRSDGKYFFHGNIKKSACIIRKNPEKYQNFSDDAAKYRARSGEMNPWP